MTNIKMFAGESTLVRSMIVCLFVAISLSSLVAVASEQLSDEAKAMKELEQLERESDGSSEVSGARKNQVTTVLDFEAEIIEGERKMPSIFFQMEIDTPSLDAVMFRRKTFNDFHQMDLERRPAYKRPE